MERMRTLEWGWQGQWRQWQVKQQQHQAASVADYSDTKQQPQHHGGATMTPSSTHLPTDARHIVMMLWQCDWQKCCCAASGKGNSKAANGQRHCSSSCQCS